MQNVEFVGRCVFLRTVNVPADYRGEQKTSYSLTVYGIIIAGTTCITAVIASLFRRRKIHRLQAENSLSNCQAGSGTAAETVTTEYDTIRPETFSPPCCDKSPDVDTIYARVLKSQSKKATQ
ncbi:hypothetical protein GN956_G27023 [Arapaima gigas]